MSKIDNLNLSKEIAKQWHNHSDADNFKRNKQFLQSHVYQFDELSIDCTHWVFAHIPKTAGTSCENYLAQMFLLQDILHINAPDLNQLPEVISLKNSVAKLITGHHPMHGLLYQLLPNQKLVHLTLLREPVSRVVSYFNYLKSRDYHVMNPEVKNMDFDAFLQQPMVELTNGQARRLAGVLHSNEVVSDMDLYESAKTVLDNCFTLVGITEKLDDFIKLIEKKCDVKINRSQPKNPSSIIIKPSDISHKQLEKIENKNKADIMLYNYVKEVFTNLTHAALNQ